MKHIELAHGNGGREMQEFLQGFLGDFYRGDWDNCANDGATFALPSGDNLCFTTDSYVVNPIEFPGGDIGHLAFSGTVNDLVVMGAEPMGISLALILEEGFDQKICSKILASINQLSQKYKIPVVTGDTKVMEKGAIDQIVINTSGVGLVREPLTQKVEPGDKIICSGGIGEHGVALLSQRFDFQTEILSDSKPVVEEMQAIRDLIKMAKDPTRGGLAATLNEISSDQGVEIEIQEDKIPVKKAVRSACDMLGIDALELANEGKIVCIVSAENAEEVVKKLQEFNPRAGVIGQVSQKLQVSNDKLQMKGKVILKTNLGSRILGMPSGQIVPRIC